MKKLSTIFDLIEKNDISIHEYTEDEKLCGYELSTYTDGGVNEILFLDFRNEGKDPKNVNDFLEEFESRINSETIDEKIDMYRQDPSYKNNFTISESLKDFQDFDKKLRRLLKQIKK